MSDVRDELARTVRNQERRKNLEELSAYLNEVDREIIWKQFDKFGDDPDHVEIEDFNTFYYLLLKAQFRRDGVNLDPETENAFILEGINQMWNQFAREVEKHE